jgi:hypothetical protein
MMAMHGDKRSRGALVALAAAAGAFGAAAMMAAAAAPTARADDFSDIINSVEAVEGYGQTAFSTADTDFASNDVIPGLQYFFDGVNDDTIGAPDIAYFGTLEALAGDPISPGSLLDFNDIPAPTDFANAVTLAQADFTEGATYSTDAATALSSGDFLDANFDSALSSIFSFDLPAQDLFIGAVEALGF